MVVNQEVVSSSSVRRAIHCNIELAAGLVDRGVANLSPKMARMTRMRLSPGEWRGGPAQRLRPVHERVSHVLRMGTHFWLTATPRGLGVGKDTDRWRVPAMGRRLKSSFEKDLKIRLVFRPN